MKIFAHRYKVSHIKRRRILKRAKKDGWLYYIREEDLKFIKVNRL
jgi:hypothetical protein